MVGHMQKIWAEQALLADGWHRGVNIEIGADGRIARVAKDSPGADSYRAGVLVPAPANCHSHAFQRAMAGLTERRGEQPWGRTVSGHGGS